MGRRKEVAFPPESITFSFTSVKGGAMGPKERVFKKAYAAELLRLADNDLVAARALAKEPTVRPETALLLAQQSVEKALKSVLCWTGKAVPLTHDIYALVDRLGPDAVPPHGHDLDDLTPYATIRRYEEGTFEIQAEDVAQMFAAVEDVLAWCKSMIEAKAT